MGLIQLSGGFFHDMDVFEYEIRLGKNQRDLHGSATNLQGKRL